MWLSVIISEWWDYGRQLFHPFLYFCQIKTMHAFLLGVFFFILDVWGYFILIFRVTSFPKAHCLELSFSLREVLGVT